MVGEGHGGQGGPRGLGRTPPRLGHPSCLQETRNLDFGAHFIPSAPCSQKSNRDKEPQTGSLKSRASLLPAAVQLVLDQHLCLPLPQFPHP